MRWKGARQSENFVDRRKSSKGGKIALGGLGGIVLVVIALFMGGDPSELMSQLQSGVLDGGVGEEVELSAEDLELGEFASVILASTEDVWYPLFRQSGETYRDSELIAYIGGTDTGGCGFGSASFGPFYCPADEKVYMDLSFNEELKTRFGATGEFALAYVIAHEIGHHVQTILGVLPQVQSMRGKLNERDFNKLMVQLELQADFYAGVWAHHANTLSGIELTYNDIREGMNAAAAVGDDRIQMQSQGYVVPEAFTHGTSEQRAYWFKKGYDTGDPSEGDTFNDPSLR